MRQLILSPFGLALAIVHWIVVLFALLGDRPEPGFNKGTTLVWYIAIVDSPALLLTSLASSVIMLVVENANLNYLYTSLAIVFCSLQWVCIGALLERMITDVSSNGIPSPVNQPEKPAQSS